MDFQPTAAVIGAGMGGLCVGVKLKQAGLDKFTLYDKAPRVGGTWHYNTYPGCVCDTPAQLYSYSFEPSADWVGHYPRGDELQVYCERVAEKYELEPHLQLGAELRSAAWETDRNKWRLSFASGPVAEVDVLVFSVGQLHIPAFPKIEGRSSFAGESFHSSRWRHDLPLRGKRVGVIGAGASAVQFVPTLVREAKHVAVFQRSASYVLPREERTVPGIDKFAMRLLRWPMKYARKRTFSWAEWMLGGALEAKDWRARYFTELAGEHLARQVRSPTLRAKLTPNYPFGCKRVLYSNDYYPALNAHNCALVTDEIERIIPEGAVTRGGTIHKLDVIIYATGFEAATFPWAQSIFGKAGMPLSEAWKEGAEAYHGIAVAGFPNFYMTYGPNTNLPHNSVTYMLERQAEYILQCVRMMETDNVGHVEVRRVAQSEYNKSLAASLADSVWAGPCSSWYKTPTGRITTNWPGETELYGRLTREPVFDDFELHPRLPTDRTQKPEPVFVPASETEPKGLQKWLD
ncbi:MAG: NAD(P)/FAD-dependent oxidoreductase [Hyphomonadaceae bacterium]|nr:NAD(P)/FAD-dependent oxidoreductase [Hyphomonadaceae bacterium]